jgi:hypothetical protein
MMHVHEMIHEMKKVRFEQGRYGMRDTCIVGVGLLCRDEDYLHDEIITLRCIASVFSGLRLWLVACFYDGKSESSS